MDPRRWAFVVAAVEAACGLGVAVYFVVLGLTAPDTPGRTAVDRAFPFVLAVLGLAVLGAMAWRSVRRAGSAPRADRDRRGGPAAAPPELGVAGTPPVSSSPSTRPRPELSGEGRAELERVVGVLARVGVLAPGVPDPEDLAEGVADAGEPVTAGSVLGAVGEAEYWHPGFDTDRYLAALAFHDGHVEQFADDLREQVDDLARLVGDALPVRLEDAEVTSDGHHRLRLRLGDQEQTFAYPGHVKYLSTVLHVAVARAARARGVRLAWLWVDQGVWIAVPTTSVEQINADLGAPDHERWEWVDEQEPTAAGAPSTPSAG